MNNATKLFMVRLIHTVVWVLFNLVLVYLFHAAINNRLGTLFWLGLGLIMAECLVLVFNRWTCPLSPIARRYTDSTRDNFDIFLPNWLAKYNIPIYSVLLLILMLILLF